METYRLPESLAKFCLIFLSLNSTKLKLNDFPQVYKNRNINVEKFIVGVSVICLEFAIPTQLNVAKVYFFVR